MQHDFNIANQGFPATRADINNAFQAIASNSSGPTAPSTTYANQWWYDTTNDKMYLRNAADSAWIEVAVLDQTNNEWKITTGVVQAKDSDGLALKTDDGTTRLFIKDSDGAVGIGTASPSTNLDVADGGNASIQLTAYSGTQNCPVQIEVGRAELSGPDSFMLFKTHDGTSLNEVARIDKNGNVGIGTSSPASVLEVRGGITMDPKSDTTNPRLTFDHDNFTGATFIEVDRGTDAMEFWNQGSEAMRIQSDGTIVFANTSASNIGSGTGAYIASNGQLFVSHEGTGYINRKSSTGAIITWRYNNSNVGSVSTNGSSTSYNTTSDYRLKENVTDVTDGITRVKQLAPKRFNFIADPDTTVDGFIAHEAQTVVPEAITGTKDAMRDEEYEVTAALGEVYTPAASATYDDDGNELTAATDEVIHSTDVAEPETLADGQFWRETTPAVMGTRTVPDYQGIDQAKLVPLLTAALQEAIAKIEDLETRVAALESA